MKGKLCKIYKGMKTLWPWFFICELTNLYTAQYGPMFTTTGEENSGFLGVAFTISIRKLANLE